MKKMYIIIIMNQIPETKMCNGFIRSERYKRESVCAKAKLSNMHIAVQQGGDNSPISPQHRKNIQGLLHSFC